MSEPWLRALSRNGTVTASLHALMFEPTEAVLRKTFERGFAYTPQRKRNL